MTLLYVLLRNALCCAVCVELATASWKHVLSSPLLFQRRVVASVTSGLLFSLGVHTSTTTAASAMPPDDRPKYSQSPTTGIQYYEYRLGEGPDVKEGSKVSLNYKGRLAGRQGWIYDDTFGREPVRLTVGTTNCIRGLEVGLVGDGQDGGMPAMRRGGKRRLVIPARLGYTSTDECPVPAEFAQRQRLYGTVLNPVRGDREKEALGDSLAGKLVLDVEVLRVSSR